MSGDSIQPWGQLCARQERVTPAPGGEEGDGNRKGRVAPRETPVWQGEHPAPWAGCALCGPGKLKA